MRAVRKDLREVENEVGRIRSIPWEMIKSHEKQARANHGQSLKKLAERGGLCVTEAVAILNDRGWVEQYPDFKIGSGISSEDYAVALQDLHVMLEGYEKRQKKES